MVIIMTFLVGGCQQNLKTNHRKDFPSNIIIVLVEFLFKKVFKRNFPYKVLLLKTYTELCGGGAGRGLGDDEKNYKLWSCSFKFAEKLVQHPIKGRTIKHHQEQNFCKRTKTSFAAAISPECKLNKTMLKPPSALHHSHSAHHLDLTLLGGKSRPNVCPLQQHCFITSLLRCCSELGMGWLMIGHVQKKVHGKYFFNFMLSVPHTLAMMGTRWHVSELCWRSV